MAEPQESSIQSHALALEALRPEGLVWTTDKDSVSRKLLEGLATELARVTCRGVDLVREADPRTTVELLEDWERVLGLPHAGDTLEPTLLYRQFAVVAKLTAAAGQSPQHFIALAAALGYTVTIEEFRPFQAGRSAAGDPLSNGEWVFTWRVHAPELSGQWATAGFARAGEALLELSEGPLQAFLEEAKPAHTQVLILRDLPWSGYAPWATLYPAPAVVSFDVPTPHISL